MIRRLQALPLRQRRIAAGLLFAAGLLAIVLVTLLLILLTLNAGGRRDSAVALEDGVRVREFALLPDEDAYPAAISAAPEGALYTGSYVSGAVWRVTPAGQVEELPGTRGALGAVAGLQAAPEGVLYIVDQWDASPLSTGGALMLREADGRLRELADDFSEPDDVTRDDAGNVYVSDRGAGLVWRLTPAGESGPWWRPPAGERAAAPTGLAWDATRQALVVTDSARDAIYRVSADGTSETLYQHGEAGHAPGLDGVTVTSQGQILVAAQSQNGLALLEDGELRYLAGVFRGISDLAWSAGRIYATNFDSFSLVVGLLRPRLPFALDVIEAGALLRG
ncbi:MAG: hypothetical protein OXB89_11345 [Anaerolineaceae bacterium]|nr:hypothetical protein [Anaerolineaceae bacterium]